MTRHLTSEEIIDAAEGQLDRTRQEHVRECRQCAGEIAAHAALLDELAAAKEIPEPSPLFWDHFSARTRAAVAADVPRPRVAVWLTPALIAAAAAAIVLAVLMRPAASPNDVSPAAVPIASHVVLPDVLPAVEDGPWDLVLDLAHDLPWEDVQQAAAPRTGTADALIDELTPQEREALVKLLKREIGDLE